MQTTSHFRRVVATTAVLAVGALTLGASAGVAAQHEPKLGLGYPSQAAGHVIRGVRDVQIRDARHMALVENARRHGLNNEAHPGFIHPDHGPLRGPGVKPIGSEQFDVPTPGTSVKVTGSVNGRGGFGWTYPGVLAGLSLAFALLAGGIALVARRVKSRTVTA